MSLFSRLFEIDQHAPASKRNLTAMMRNMRSQAVKTNRKFSGGEESATQQKMAKLLKPATWENYKSRVAKGEVKHDPSYRERQVFDWAKRDMEDAARGQIKQGKSWGQADLDAATARDKKSRMSRVLKRHMGDDPTKVSFKLKTEADASADKAEANKLHQAIREAPFGAAKNSLQDKLAELARKSGARRGLLKLSEGSLGQKRTERKAALTAKRGYNVSVSHDDDPATREEKFKRLDDTSKKIGEIRKKGERGGRWGTDHTSPASRRAERDLAGDYAEKHADIIQRSSGKNLKKSPLPYDGYAYSPGFFYRRLRKHADSQGTRHPGDESGVARTTRLDKPVRMELKAKAKAERRLGPKPVHPAIAAADTKARLTKDRAERAKSAEYMRQSKLPKSPWD